MDEWKLALLIVLVLFAVVCLLAELIESNENAKINQESLKKLFRR